MAPVAHATQRQALESGRGVAVRLRPAGQSPEGPAHVGDE